MMMMMMMMMILVRVIKYKSDVLTYKMC